MDLPIGVECIDHLARDGAALSRAPMREVRALYARSPRVIAGKAGCRRPSTPTAFSHSLAIIEFDLDSCLQQATSANPHNALQFR